MFCTDVSLKIYPNRSWQSGPWLKSGKLHTAIIYIHNSIMHTYINTYYIGMNTIKFNVSGIATQGS